MYTDPGTLSMIIAGIVGVILAVPTYLLVFKNKIKAWLNDRRKKQL